MADFCRACSILIFDRDYGEMAGITAQKDWDEGRACPVLCEGCGPIQVDPDGNCVSGDCIEKGKEGHGLPWKNESGDESCTETSKTSRKTK
jgi:hypothetical protein